MAILDSRGRPVSARGVSTQRIATELNDYMYFRMGRVILNPDPVISSEAGNGPMAIQLYETLLRDDQVMSTLQARKLAVCGREWTVDPASEDATDVEIAEFVERVLNGFDFDAAKKGLLDALILGYKVGEVIWKLQDNSMWIKQIVCLPSRRFMFDAEHNLRLLTITNMAEGEEVPDRKFITYRNEDANGSPYGSGLGRAIYWPVWFKKNGVKFWAIFLEKFGSPTAVGHYPPGADVDSQTALMAALESIQTESAIKIPDGMVIELLEAQRAGKMDTYGVFVKHWDAQISKIVLGHSAAADATPGKLGNEDRATQVADDYLKADADSLSMTFNETIIKWLVDLNYGPVKAYPKFWIRTDDEPDLKPQAERDKILVVDIGLPVMKQYFYETYGIPEPTGGEDDLVNPPKPEPIMGVGPDGKPIAPKVPGAKPGQKVKAPKGKEPGNEGKEFAENRNILYPDQFALDRLADSITPQDMQAQAKGLLKPLIDMVQAGTNHVEILGELAKAFPVMDASELQKVLATALYYADIIGRVSAREEI